MAAKDSQLSELHSMLTELLLQDIRMCLEENIPMPASDKAVIIKFLKDNNVTAEPDVEAMQALRNEFDEKFAETKVARLKRGKELIQQTQEGVDDIVQGLVN